VTTSPDALLVATDLTRIYPLAATRRSDPADRRTVVAVDGISITVGAGERVGLVGASGSGKSTLLRMLLALEAPDAGRITFTGQDVLPGRTSDLRWFRRQVQYIPQDPASSLDPRRRVEQIIREPLRRLGIPGDHRNRVREVLDAVGLGSQYAGRRPLELSGGQCQRVAMARAIAPAPRLIVADEPVSGLDLPLREQIIGMLDELSGALGTAILIVSHDLSVVARLCERCAVMTNGRIVEDRPTSAILESPEHEYTRLLIDSVPRLILA
jgi:peptide/nickel transport system ATP-binding protein